jgi:hypothetical protein
MYRTSSRCAVLLLLALGASGAQAQDAEVLLRVRVTHVAFTEYYPADDCPAGDSNCIQFYFWFRYEAQVREVVRGRFAGHTVAFANLQHSYFARMPQNWYVSLVPCGKGVKEAVGVEYCVVDQAFAKDRVGLKRLMAARHGA